MKGQKLGTVTSFRYLGVVVSDGGSKQEVPSRIAQAPEAQTKVSQFREANKKSQELFPLTA